MPATAQQITDFREDIGDVGTPPVFDDEAIQRLYDRATAAYSDATIYEAEMRVIGIRQLLLDSAKRVTYKQNQSSENQSDIFKHLKEALDIWTQIRNGEIEAQAGGGVGFFALTKTPKRKKDVPGCWD